MSEVLALGANMNGASNSTKRWVELGLMKIQHMAENWTRHVISKRCGGMKKSPCVQEAKVEEPSYLRQQSNPQGHEHEGWNELLVRGSVEMIPFSVVCL